MKLAIVTHKVIKGDGQGRVNYAIAWEALSRDHHVFLVASGVDTQLQQHPRIQWVDMPVWGWPTQLLRNQVFAWRSARWLNQHRRELDLVHLNGSITWAPGEVNTAHLVHGAWLRSPVHTAQLRRGPYGWYHWLNTALNARWEKRAFRQALVVVAVSEKVRQELRGIGIPAENIRVIANGVDPEEFMPGPADRPALGLPGGVPLALFAGNIRTPAKNLDAVLKALVRVPEVHLAVAGSLAGSIYPALSRRLGLAGRVHFLDYRPDMVQLMRAADLFVLPSRYDSFGLVILEAMASGLPVITARTVGAADLVQPECGIVLDDPDNSEALVRALTELAGDPERRKRMGSAARAIAEQHSWTNMARTYVDLFEDLSR